MGIKSKLTSTNIAYRVRKYNDSMTSHTFYQILMDSFETFLLQFMNRNYEAIKIAHNNKNKISIFLEPEEFSPGNIFFEHKQLPGILSVPRSYLIGGYICLKKQEISSLVIGGSTLGDRSLGDTITASRVITTKFLDCNAKLSSCYKIRTYSNLNNKPFYQEFTIESLFSD